MNRSADPSLIAAIFHAVQEADQKAIKQEDEHGFVTFYTFPCGPWHKIIGLVRQLPVSEADLLPYLSPPPDQPLRAMEDPRAAAASSDEGIIALLRAAGCSGKDVVLMVEDAIRRIEQAEARAAELTAERDEAKRTLAAFQQLVEAADQKAIRVQDAEGWVTLYKFPTGPWHKILGLSRSLSGLQPVDPKALEAYEADMRTRGIPEIQESAAKRAALADDARNRRMEPAQQRESARGEADGETAAYLERLKHTANGIGHLAMNDASTAALQLLMAEKQPERQGGGTELVERVANVICLGIHGHSLAEGGGGNAEGMRQVATEAIAAVRGPHAP